MGKGPRIIPEVVIIGEREIVRMGKRWIIYLPTELNDLWEVIKKKGRRVRIYVEIVE